MKKLLAIAAAILFSGAVCAQNDVTKFLGIPVDGTKSEMIQKLEEKGFKYNSVDDYLEGEFNGKDAHLYVGTNNNKVYRIMVADANTTNETNIKIRFNNLCYQFDNNPKYESFGEDYTISDQENIRHEITLNNKRYEAIYFQAPQIDSLAIERNVEKELVPIITSKYTKEELANPTEDQVKEIADFIAKYSTEYTMQLYSKKQVWFIISEHYGKYYICMYYDNKYNQANGEDL